MDMAKGTMTTMEMGAATTETESGFPPLTHPGSLYSVQPPDCRSNRSWPDHEYPNI